MKQLITGGVVPSAGDVRIRTGEPLVLTDAQRARVVVESPSILATMDPDGAIHLVITGHGRYDDHTVTVPVELPATEISPMLDVVFRMTLMVWMDEVQAKTRAAAEQHLAYAIEEHEVAP